MDSFPNEIIEQIYCNLDTKSCAELSMTSKMINECRPDYSLDKHKVIFSKVLNEIKSIKYFIKGKRRAFDNREYRCSFVGDLNMIKYVDEPQVYSIRTLNGRTTATAVFADTLKAKYPFVSEFKFRYTLEIYSDDKSKGTHQFSRQQATWKLQNGLSIFFREFNSVYVYSYSNTQRVIIEN